MSIRFAANPKKIFFGDPSFILFIETTILPTFFFFFCFLQFLEISICCCWVYYFRQNFSRLETFFFKLFVFFSPLDFALKNKVDVSVNNFLFRLASHPEFRKLRSHYKIRLLIISLISIIRWEYRRLKLFQK